MNQMNGPSGGNSHAGKRKWEALWDGCPALPPWGDREDDPKGDLFFVVVAIFHPNLKNQLMVHWWFELVHWWFELVHWWFELVVWIAIGSPYERSLLLKG